MVWLTQIFYFKTFVTEFFRLKKKMPEKLQKNVWGASLFICPKMTLMVKKNYEKIIFMDSAQF